MTTASSSELQQAPERGSADQSKIAYQRPQPAGMVPDVFVGSALGLDGDELEWVPQSDTVAFRSLVLNVSQGYYINILRVRSSGVLSRHLILDRCMPSRCAEGGATSSTTGSLRPATTHSSRPARRTLSSFRTRSRRWPRSFT
jgi:hypothetical protein